jgi:hypothetical protein
MPGGKGGPGEGMGNGFLRSKADKRGMDGLIAFIPELLPVYRRENMISIVVEEEEDQGAQHSVILPAPK